MIEKLQSCTLCPHNCKVNRLEGIMGRCKCTSELKIALSSLHYFEEPCISGKNGSGTVFFSNCNLKCIYCQNYEISDEGYGKNITIQELADIFINQQEKGANNINLVTPTMYVYHIIEALKIAKSRGLKIPIIYNTNGYEKEETIEMLNGYIDVYLPDLKYAQDKLAKKYSGVDNYFNTATKAIKKMYEQVGKPIFDEKGLIKKGVIIRHLILPNNMLNTKVILKWIKNNLPQAYISIMAQYFPTYKAKQDRDLNRKINIKEYKEIENYLYELNLESGYIQELGEHEEEYVPNFKLENGTN